MAPANSIEAELCALWSELLGVDRVGTADHFFDLGGHSLLAAQAIARIRDAHGVPLSVRNLLDNPTVAAPGVVMESLTASAEENRSPNLAPIDRSAFSAHGVATFTLKTKQDSDV